MEKQGMGRREILRTVGFAAGGAALTTAAMASSAHADGGDDHENDNGRGINGSWLVTAVAKDQPDTLVVASFAAGGVAISHEIKPAGPPFTGSWARNSGDGFRATFWSGFPDNSTAKLHVMGNIGSDGRIAGTFTATVFDPVTDQPVQTFSGTFTGKRIVA